MGFFTTLFKIMPACTSTMMCLSPVPSIYKAYKTKSTGVASIVPLVSMLTNCHLALLFGYLKELYFPLVYTMILGDTLSLTYVVVFYIYSHEKPKAHKVFAAFGSALVILTTYAFIGGYGLTDQTRDNVGQTVGYFGTTATVILYTSPLEKVAMVLKHRSGVFFNIHMLCAGTFNNLMWVCYGFTVHEWLVYGPNIFCCTMGCLQISLYMIYHPSTHPYDGPIPGISPEIAPSVTMDMNELQDPSATSRAKNKIESPSYVALKSPLEPLHKHSPYTETGVVAASHNGAN